MIKHYIIELPITSKIPISKSIIYKLIKLLNNEETKTNSTTTK